LNFPRLRVRSASGRLRRGARKRPLRVFAQFPSTPRPLRLGAPAARRSEAPTSCLRRRSAAIDLRGAAALQKNPRAMLEPVALVARTRTHLFGAGRQLHAQALDVNSAARGLQVVEREHRRTMPMGTSPSLGPGKLQLLFFFDRAKLGLAHRLRVARAVTLVKIEQ